MRTAFVLILLSCNVAFSASSSAKFAARRDYPSGGFAQVADVNGDHIPDLIVVIGHTISTLLGKGDGTFRQGPSTLPGFDTVLTSIAIDLNGDGKIDLIITGGPYSIPGGIGVCFGNGDGTFEPAVFYQAGNDPLIEDLVVGDFNNDGIPDVVLTGEFGYWLFTGKGGGVFNPGVLVPMTNIANGGLVATDFNGDGNLDLAIGISAGATPGFAIVFGNGDGTFQPPIMYRTKVNQHWLASADLNGDGHPDIVLGASPVPIFLNDGSGGFGRPSYASIPCGGPIAIGDVNGDHIPDLMCGGNVVLGLGAARFSPSIYYPANSSVSINILAADLRKTGRTDMVLGQNDAVSVLLNQGQGTFGEGEWVPLAGSGDCGATADFNGDGKPDLAVITSQGITILLGTGNAKTPYITGPSIAVSGEGCPLTSDLNGDGIPDLMVGAGSLNGVGAFLGNGDGTFRLASVVPMSPGFLAIGDFNHDGKPDLADTSNMMAFGNGDGTFQTPVVLIANPPPLGYNWIAAGDMNNDGWDDIVATQWTYDSLYVFVNDQHGGFTLTATATDKGAPEAVSLMDLNGDGNLDAVVMVLGSDSVSTYLGDGHGGITLRQKDIPYPGPDNLLPSVGDVNGDGIPDILLPADGSIGIALGKGDGTFFRPFAVGAGPGLGQVLIESLHGQLPGLPDLVAPDNSGGIMVLLNLTH